MTPQQVHLALNHFPIMGTLFGLCLLAYALYAKNKSIEHAALVTFIVIGVLTIPVWLTGDSSAEAIRHMDSVSEYYIGKHSTFGFFGFIVIAVNMLLSAFTLYRSLKGKAIAILPKLVLVISIAAMGMMLAAGHYGGKINHPELRGFDTVEETMEQPAGDAD